MNIIDNGPLGVRTAVLRMVSQQDGCTYVLYPMVHIGEARFYRDVVHELAGHDHILIEGVRHPLINTMTSMYGKVAASPRFRLAVQTIMAAGLQPLKDRIRNIDAPSELFQAWWRQQPLVNRLFLPALVRLAFWHMAKFGNRRSMARRMALDLAPTRDSIFRMGNELEFTKLIVHRRDEHIVKKLDEFHEALRGTTCTVGILFGAGHMRAIVRHLIDRRGYHVAQGRWLTIFGWDLPTDRAPAT